MKSVYTNKAPEPVGPYSQAIRVGPWLFCSGQIPLNLDGSLTQDIESQTQQVLKNIQAVLMAEQMTFKNVVKNMIFLTDLTNFVKFNKIYESYFTNPMPARSCVEVSALPKGVKIEIECTAYQA